MIRDKIYNTFYYLAGLDLLTILISVLIAYGYSKLTLEIKSSGQTWLEYESQFDELSDLIINLSKPGNDVFEKLDYIEKKAEFESIKILIDAGLENLKRTLNRSDVQIEKQFSNIDSELKTFEFFAQSVFLNIEKGEIALASSEMARMDEGFQRTLKNFLILRKTLRNDYFVQTQLNLEKTRDLRNVENYIWAFLLVLIVAVIYYGLKVRIEVIKSEDSLKDLHSSHEYLFNSVSEHSIIVRTDRKGVITYVNDRFCETSKYSREELIGQTHRVVKSSHHPKSFYEEMWAQITAGKVWRGEICNRAKNGEYYWVDTTITPVFDSKGELSEFLAIRTDITARKAAEKFSDDIQSVALLGGFRFEKQSQKISLTNESYRLLDIKQSENLDFRQVTDRFVGKNRKKLISQVLKCFKYASSFKGDYELKSTNGNRIWVRIICNPGMNIHDEISYVYGTAQNISIQKKQEQQIISEKNQAEKAKSAKSNFLANMSHEMRTPLNGLIGMTELLLETELNSKQREMLETIDSCSENMLGLVNRVLNLSKIEAGKFELDLSAIDIKKMANVAIKNSVPAFGEVKFEFDYRLPEGAMYQGDGLRIQQVIVNYIANAFKFTKEGEVRLTISEEKMGDLQSEITFAVSDTGVGIPENKLESVFDPFNQVDSSITKKYGGTGLGLSICREVAKLMGGEVWVESKVDKGTCFYFKTKLKKIHKGSSESPEMRKDTILLSDDNVKVLIVEDNLINQKIASHMLKSLGVSSHVAGNGQIALEMIEQSIIDKDPYSFILMDVQMPVMDGIAATKEICRRWSDIDIYIVALTANAFEEDKKRCFDAGMSDFLSKPFKKSNLLEVFEKYFDRYDKAS